jgi:LDH2 family malate/lactate/ureidoglycolate dehydrogenase
MSRTYTEAELLALANRLLLAADVPPAHADLVAEALVEADVRGMTSHGLMRLPVYIRRIQSGGIDPHAIGVIESETASAVMIDGQAGLGQVIAMRAMKEAVARARKTGVGIAGVRNSNHFGEAAYYVQPAIDAGMIALVTTNGSPNMPPWGGVTHMIGTLPLAVGVPAGEAAPVVLDMALGAVSKGKILNAAKTGATMPDGWGVDKRGVPTNDPQVVLDGGWTPPIGGHKGFGLLVALEVLAGVLTGAAVGPDIGDLYGADDQPQDLGHFLMAIDIATFVPTELFGDRMDRMISRFKSSELVPGVDKIRMPGEVELDTAALRRRTGIPMSDEVMNELVLLESELSPKAS